MPTCNTVNGTGLDGYRIEHAAAGWRRRTLRVHRWQRRATTRLCCAAIANPFRADGGLRVLDGNLGRAVIKVSAVPADRAAGRSAGRGVRRAGRRARPHSSAANSIATSSPWCVSRARARTACRSCTNSRRRSACCRIAVSRRAGHRRAHVRRLRQGAGGDPRHAGSSRAAAAIGQDPRWRHRAPRRECRYSGRKSG